MTTYLKQIFALVAVLLLAGCDLLGDLDFLPSKPDGGDDTPLTTSPERLSLVSPQSGVELEYGESVDVTFMVEAYSPVTGQYWACEDAAVVFETESGELSEGVAISDDKGMVSVTWSPTAMRAATKSHTLYARIYASDGAIIDEATFVVKTEAEGCDDANHPHAVDLGLSVKWACCNVGASSPEDYGDYFAWGETSPKSSYTYENYQHWVDYDGDGWFDVGEYTLYSDISGTQYDAARANWDGSWRMPTFDECIELCEECEFTWTSVNGINGMRVTGPSGNSIFLSAVGYRRDSSVYDVGEYGFYWSSPPDEDDGAYFIVVYNSPYPGGGGSGNYPDGYTVRPVTE